MNDIEMAFGAAKAAETGGQNAPSPAAPDISGAFAPSKPGASQPVGGSVPSGFSPAVKTPGSDAMQFGERLSAQYQSLFNAAKTAARQRMRFGANSSPVRAPQNGGIAAVLGASAPQGGQSAVRGAGTPPAPSSAPSAASGEAPKQVGADIGARSPEEPAYKPIGGVAAQGVKMTMSREFGGAGEVPSYQYGGASIQLPAGLDLNDDAKVQEAIDSTNRSYDAMNSAYAEYNEEF